MAKQAQFNFGEPAAEVSARAGLRALSLTQPWATLMALLAKQWETRSWATRYRGRVAIHAAKGFPGDAKDLCMEEPYRSVLAAAGHTAKSLPRGAILAVGELTDCRQTTLVAPELSPQEIAFGNYGQGRFAWKFENVRRLPQPIVCNGALSLWRVPDEVAMEIVAALASI